MKFQVLCGGTYCQEVEADNADGAVAKAFSISLPLGIGEIMGVRSANNKKKKGWNATTYSLTEPMLARIGARHLYIMSLRGKRKCFSLNTNSPDAVKI